MYEEYGRDAAINDGGRFTEQGYIYNNRNTFTQWYDGRDVPEEYRVTPQPPVQEKEQADLDASAAIQTACTCHRAAPGSPDYPIFRKARQQNERDYRPTGTGHFGDL